MSLMISPEADFVAIAAISLCMTGRELAREARGLPAIWSASPTGWSLRIAGELAACLPFGGLIAWLIFAAYPADLNPLSAPAGLAAGTLAIYPLCLALARGASQTREWFEPKPFTSAGAFATALYLTLPMRLARWLFHSAVRAAIFAIGVFATLGVIGLLLFGIRQL